MQNQQASTTHSQLDINSVTKKLAALAPAGQQQKIHAFQQLYIGVEETLARNVPQKSIIALLQTEGLSLSLGGFRSLLNAERERRKSQGDLPCCSMCNSVLPRIQSESSPTTGINQD
ncbi:hypothetical protein [uncultured Oxalicibacterium sp.]|uniref:hypothetical protein n=1 Tax=uncultured Oxalicibacterium sp. TaxID=1168540 RepID=UPI0025F0C769|nr:hypothetical protein [uncultured Oxalicibacterium sp.]